MKRTLLLFSILLFLSGCQDRSKTPTVTVYVSEDQVFSEPVLKDFEKETGIKVKAVYDTEESKSTGVMNRILAEKNHPQADVYWANEPIRAELLHQKGLLEAYQSPMASDIDAVFKEPSHYWTGFSARMRLFIAQKKLPFKPDSILDYTAARFYHKAVIANPLFGTTTAHIAALFTIWGKAKTEAFLTALKKNGVMLSTSNGESADFVASKSAWFALVDSDDAVSRLKAGKDIRIIYPDQKEGEIGVFVVPNTVMLLKNAPHPQTAKKLIDYLLSPKTEKKLAFADCAQIPLHPNVAMPAWLKPLKELKVMPVDYVKVAQKMLEIQPWLEQWLKK